jgi:hypothetical protein
MAAATAATVAPWSSYLGWLNWKTGAALFGAALIVYVCVRYWNVIRGLGFSYGLVAAFPFLGGLVSAATGVPLPQMLAEIDAFQRGVHPTQRPELYQTPKLPSPTEEDEPLLTPEKSDPKEEKKKKKEEPEPEPEPEKKEDPKPVPEEKEKEEAKPTHEPEEQKKEEAKPIPEPPVSGDFDENGEPITREGLIVTLMDEALGEAEFKRQQEWDEKKRLEQEALQRQAHQEEANARRLEAQRQARERQAEAARDLERKASAAVAEQPRQPSPEKKEENDMETMQRQHQAVMNALAANSL